ncbi:uncharacterized protein LOC129228078 [Uloborus diversus]|uniref:uncharacterized protein LOC129228078 n=1 Tax=Uloborus diversus TaxID=327109 RepID=UPI00240998F0|nr:uncharacterized protein LOC129228078 [Uloborus diversus]
MYLMSVFIIFALTYSLLIFLSLKLHHHVKWWHHIALFLHMISQAITVSILVAVYEWLSVLSTYLFLSVAFSILFLFTLQRRMEYKYWAVIAICGIFLVPTTIVFQVLLHCSDRELVHSIGLSALLFLYHIFSIEVFLRRLCTDEHVKAAILLYVIPQNIIHIMKLKIPKLFKSTGS